MSTINTTRAFASSDVPTPMAVVTVWWAGNRLNSDPLARFVVHPDTSLDRIMDAVLKGIDFDEDHWWHFRVDDTAPVGHRRCPTTNVSTTPPHWVAYVSDEEYGDSPNEDLSVRRASVTPLSSVTTPGDELWALFDYGHRYTFRIKVTAPKPSRDRWSPTETARISDDITRTGVSVLITTPIEQYPPGD